MKPVLNISHLALFCRREAQTVCDDDFDQFSLKRKANKEFILLVINSKSPENLNVDIFSSRLRICYFFPERAQSFWHHGDVRQVTTRSLPEAPEYVSQEPLLKDKGAALPQGKLQGGQ